MTPARKRCDFCKKRFLPDARAGQRQYCCTAPACQTTRRILTNRIWHRRHPDYSRSRKIKIRSWLRRRPNYWREWRKKHPEYVARDNHRRVLRCRSVKLSAKQNLRTGFSDDAVKEILNFFEKFSAKHDLIHRRKNSLNTAPI